MKNIDIELFEMCLLLSMKYNNIDIKPMLVESSFQNKENLKEIFTYGLAFVLNEWGYEEIVQFATDLNNKFNPSNYVRSAYTIYKNNLPEYSVDKYVYLLRKAKKAYESGELDQEAYRNYKNTILKIVHQRGDTQLFNRTMDILDKQETNVLAQAKDKVDLNIIAQYGKQAGYLFASIAVAAVVMYIAYQIYKKFFSKAARACKQYKGEKKKECLLNYQLDALQKQNSLMRKGLSICKNTTDPDKCEKAIRKKIEKTEQKIKKLKSKR